MADYGIIKDSIDSSSINLLMDLRLGQCVGQGQDGVEVWKKQSEDVLVKTCYF